MKNLNQEGLNELSQNELTHIEGGGDSFLKVLDDFIEENTVKGYRPFKHFE